MFGDVADFLFTYSLSSNVSLSSLILFLIVPSLLFTEPALVQRNYHPASYS
jgi:hypothetical protein